MAGPSDQLKRQAADAALEHLPESGVVGLGSGSTAELFIAAVAKLVANGRQLSGVATSDRSRQLAESLGIPLLADEGPWAIDVCVDGADEISDRLDVIKGGGGCHTREKIVNAASRFNIIVADDSKRSDVLGRRWAVPVEVLPFGHQSTLGKLRQLGPVELRLRGGAPWMTDAGNYLYDVRLGPIDDPAGADRQLKAVPGVVETGLFVDRTHLVLVAGAGGLERLTPG